MALNRNQKTNACEPDDDSFYWSERPEQIAGQRGAKDKTAQNSRGDGNNNLHRGPLEEQCGEKDKQKGNDIRYCTEAGRGKACAHGT